MSSILFQYYPYIGEVIYMFLLYFLKIDYPSPIVHNFKINKSPTREVFTFKGIQSVKGVTHLRETRFVYNNIYLDVERDSGLIIPKTLIKTENRPKKQLKTSRHTLSESGLRAQMMPKKSFES